MEPNLLITSSSMEKCPLTPWIIVIIRIKTSSFRSQLPILPEKVVIAWKIKTLNFFKTNSDKNSRNNDNVGLTKGSFQKI